MIGYAFWKAKSVTKASEPFSSVDTDAELRVLVAGDSTAAGVGVDDPLFSTPGMLYQDLKKHNTSVSLINVSQSGAQIADVSKQIESIEGQFDMVLLQVGANDIVYFSSQREATQELTKLIETLKQKSQCVVHVVSGNIGASPVFLWPLSWVYEHRTQSYLEKFRSVAEEQNIIFVEFFEKPSEDPFLTDTRRFYASDSFHPSRYGYENWYKKIRQNIECVQDTFFGIL